jgi:hypothetical protein
VDGDADAGHAVFAGEVHKVERVAQLALGQVLGRGQGWVAVQGEEVLDT